MRPSDFHLWQHVIVQTGGEDEPGMVMDNRPPLHLLDCVRVSFSNGTSQWIDTKYVAPAAPPEQETE